LESPRGEGGLPNVRARERLLAHEQQHKVAVDVAGKGADRAQLFNASKGPRGTTGNGLEQLVRLLDNREDGVVSAKAHAGDLLAVDLEQLAPHGGRVFLVRADERMLRGGKVGADVAGGLLLSKDAALEGSAMAQLDLSVDRVLLSSECNDLAVGVLGGNNEVQLGLFPRLVDDAPEAHLAKPGRHAQAPGHPVCLVELRNGGSADRLLVLVLWSPWTLGFASEIMCSVTLYISLEA
jgi:hypothetical protein